MKIKKIFFAVIALSIASLAQSAAPAAAPQKTYVHAGHLLDVKTGKLLDNVLVTIEGDRISSVGSGSAPAGAKVIDLPNATLVPGLIDAHTHITYDPNFGYQELGVSLPKEALIGAKNARLTLEAGFTTVRNLGASGYADVALRDAINEGMVPGPRMDVSGPAPPLPVDTATRTCCHMNGMPKPTAPPTGWSTCSKRCAKSLNTART